MLLVLSRPLSGYKFVNFYFKFSLSWKHVLKFLPLSQKIVCQKIAHFKLVGQRFCPNIADFVSVDHQKIVHLSSEIVKSFYMVYHGKQWNLGLIARIRFVISVCFTTPGSSHVI